MFSFSTSWNALLHKDGRRLIDEIRQLGFDTVELSFNLTEDMVSDILALKRSSVINISSTHNMCPLPKEVEQDEASPDFYSLASPDEAERKLAVEVAKNTVGWAKRLGAKAVVLHTGRVQIKDRTRDLARLSDAGEKGAFDKLKAEMIAERAANKDGYLDNIMRSLNELIPYAKDNSIKLGIENRYYYREIPLADELGEIFKEFKSGDIYYWHDMGHAGVFERLGLYKHEELLDKFGPRLIGVHIHDIMGINKDHQPPGAGTMDFNIIKPYLKADTIKVLEVHQPATASDIKRGFEYISKVLG